MAKIDLQKDLTDAAIVVAGGGLLNTYVVGNVQFIGDLMMKIPVVMGISLSAVVLGTAALYAARKWLIK